MNTRRDFLAAAAAGSALFAAAPLMAQSGEAKIGAVVPTQGARGALPMPINAPGTFKRFVPVTRIGQGGAPAGNNFQANTPQDIDAMLQAAWDGGMRTFDTSPWYGLGLSERRFGHFLSNQPRDAYVLSTKIGRVLTASSAPSKTSWKQPSPFDYRYDYSAAGVRRSVEDSLQRLGVSRLDIVYVHDLSPDNGDMGARWTEYFTQAEKGAFPELTRMREEGLIKAWGMGVNTPQPALRAIEVADPDMMLLACQYSLLDHDQALRETFPKLQARDVSVMVGSPLLAGYLVGRERYLYGGRPVPKGAAEKRRLAGEIAQRHGVDLRTAALQFAAAPTLVSSIIPGARNAAQAAANAESMRVAIPAAFWEDLRRAKVITAEAPVPRSA
ncbi:D-threo-aldose 1-dehydrogenase [Pseudoxanthomonas sp. GM95]|uniref:aldo/keto reductase n=1 Tax=Pseudoxanthomonas sp. GM95 TaxID=1881043 RepID=UPI0008AE5F3A|nr:aldo/keto reductase [Pseudoxanthomonas sp. GM95]SEM23017.1 D-threo-aldose 1-dehydrogenase [Pseudoxanthomonas sp. GM95]